MRYLIVALVVCSLVWLGATAVGRAIDHEIQDRILIPGPNGQTLDCERITDVAGNTFYDSCQVVP